MDLVPGRCRYEIRIGVGETPARRQRPWQIDRHALPPCAFRHLEGADYQVATSLGSNGRCRYVDTTADGTRAFRRPWVDRCRSIHPGIASNDAFIVDASAGCPRIASGFAAVGKMPIQSLGRLVTVDILAYPLPAVRTHYDVVARRRQVRKAYHSRGYCRRHIERHVA